MQKDWLVVATVCLVGAMVLGTGCGQTVLFPGEGGSEGLDAGVAPPPTLPGVATSIAPATPSCGAATTLCAEGAACKTGADCTSGVCKDGVCAAPTSSDGVKNGAETDTDCGGPTAPPCVFGKVCQTEKDCAKELVCKGGKCELLPCVNNVTDGAESDVDCGGTCATKCDAGKTCNVNEDCASKVCTNGKCSAPSYSDKVKNGTETDVDCGGAADAPKCKDTKACAAASDCESVVCDPATKTCSVPTCTDGVTNGLETDRDCGGVCKTKCDVAKKCKEGGDCVSQVCTPVALTCAAPSYTDGKKNGTETDVDCGGAANAPKCKDTKACAAVSDCESGVCAGPADGKTCVAPGCADAVKNGVETDVDCGGANACNRCVTTKACLVGSDCRDKVCGGTATCSAASCTDAVQNATETDVDCGGTCAAKCDDTKKCADDVDCKSGFCKTQVCQVPSCADQRKNADETDVDCGGDACRGTKKCADTKACKVDGDCASGVCDNFVCQKPTCTDRATNGTETDRNCGGSCAPCADGKACGADNTNCESLVCKNGVCAVPTCNDATKNGAESDRDCGGTCAPCADGKVCKVSGDCVNKVCSGGNAPVCLAASCMDGVQNGLETDVNCGGGTCDPCGDNLSCKADGDCKSSLCQNLKCTPASCPDNRQNQDETDTDCGGAMCVARCVDGKKCKVGSDCQSQVCGPLLTCSVPTCSDGKTNGAESDLDCGATCGTDAKKCDTAKACKVAGDCKSGRCVNFACAAPTCTDSVLNQDETDTDCGGAACRATRPCVRGKLCKVTQDCVAGTTCVAGGRCCPDGATASGGGCAYPVYDGVADFGDPVVAPWAYGWSRTSGGPLSFSNGAYVGGGGYGVASVSKLDGKLRFTVITNDGGRGAFVGMGVRAPRAGTYRVQFDVTQRIGNAIWMVLVMKSDYTWGTTIVNVGTVLGPQSFDVVLEAGQILSTGTRTDNYADNTVVEMSSYTIQQITP